MPLALWAVSKAIMGRSICYSLASGAIITIALFAGHPQYFYYLVLLLIVYAVWGTGRNGKGFIDHLSGTIVALSIAFSLFLILGSAQLIPTVNMLSKVARFHHEDMTYFVTNSLDARMLVSLLTPYIFGGIGEVPWLLEESFWEVALFCGWVPLLLVILTIPWLRITKNIRFFWVASLISLLLAMGSHTAIYSFFCTILPGLALFRAPARILVITFFSFSVLAGWGLARFIESDNKGRMRFIAFGWIALSLLSLAIILIAPHTILKGKEGLAQVIQPLNSVSINALAIEVMIGFFLFISIWIFHHFKLVSRALPGILIILALVAELYVFDRNFIRSVELDDYFWADEYIDFCANDPVPHRIITSFGGVQFLNYGMVAGYENVNGGNDPMILAHYQQFINRIEGSLGIFRDSVIVTVPSPQYGELAARYLIIDQVIEQPGFRPVYMGTRALIYQIMSYHPMSRFIDSTGNMAAGAGFKRLNPNRFLVKTNHGNGILRVSLVNYPGWTVSLGDEKMVLPFDGKIYYDIDHPGGERNYLFSFEPFDFRLGSFISLLGLCIVTAFYANRLIGPSGLQTRKTWDTF